MKLLKQIDVVVQAVAIIGAITYYIVTRNIEYAIGSYFIVGGLQLISCIAHLFAEPIARNKRLRKIYYYALLVIGLSIIVVLIAKKLAIAIMLGWLFVTPFMAFYYLYICIKELNTLKEEPV